MGRRSTKRVGHQDACGRKAGQGSPVPLPTSVPVDFLPDAVSCQPRHQPVSTLSPSRRNRAAGSAAGAQHASASSLNRWPRPARSIWRPSRRGCRREALMRSGSLGRLCRCVGCGAAVGGRPLSALAFDRAIHGRVEQFYRDGELIGEKQLPSDKLLTWLLARLDPKRFAAPWERHKDDNPTLKPRRSRPFLPCLTA